MSTESRFSTKKVNDVTVVRINEESVSDTDVIRVMSKELNSLAEALDKANMVLDFQDVSFVSSSGIGMLVTLRKKAESNKGKLVISSLNEDLYKLFKITNLDKLFEFANNEDDAIKKLEATSAS